MEKIPTMKNHQDITVGAHPFRGMTHNRIHNHYAAEDMSAISDFNLRYGHQNETGNRGGNSKSKNCGSVFFA
jgi:hypothetical protein